MMIEEKVLRGLLDNKIPKASEATIHFFEKCNLNCSFCGQDHDSDVGLDSIVDKANETLEFIKKTGMKENTVNLMGGELFSDIINDETFDDYYKYYLILKEGCDDLGVKFQLNFVTNLIFRKNIGAVKSLMDLLPKDNVFISTSYDFAGRGLDINNSLLFKQNLITFKDRIRVVGFVMTRASIRKLMADKDKYFKEVLYPNFDLFFDYYVPEHKNAKYLPSEQEMLDAFLFIARNYPKISPIRNMIENDHNELTCPSLNKITKRPDGSEVTCRMLRYDQEDFHTKMDLNSNVSIINSHMQRSGCLGCEWFNKCMFRCFVQHDWVHLEKMDECFIKTFFNKTIDLHGKHIY